MMETIKTPSRLHMSLIDMNGALGRVDGGVGIALEEPCFEIGFGKAGGVSGVSGDAKEIAEAVCSKFGVGGVEIRIKKSIPEHIGFGSKTQLSLAIAAGICRAYGIKKSVRELAELVGRGGTSGIGVAAFEGGGFILDGGHLSGKGFMPSRFSHVPPAPVLARHDFPWKIVCAWPEGKGSHGEAEKNVFGKYCPIPAEEVEKVSRLVMMKVLPAIVEKDLEAFGEGLNMLQEIGFKRIEITLQTAEVKKVLAFMQGNSAGGGMSSFGPVCFAVCGSMAEAKSLESAVQSEFNGINTVITSANNEGARWS